MRWFPVLLLVLLADNTLGFSQHSIQNSRHRSLANEKCFYDSNTALRATGFPTRRKAIGVSFCGLLTNLLGASISSANEPSNNGASTSTSTVAFQTISMPVEEFGVKVPVSVWSPISDDKAKTSQKTNVKYEYKISLRRIGQLLAKWQFIPEFVSRDFSLTPSMRVVQSNSATPIEANKVVFLAHGFLGSRTDLSYLAEELAAQGFVCVAAEYPESLEASYPRLEGLDRLKINQKLVPYVRDNLVSGPIESYSAIGHSLGCGTVLQMGDDSWSRVLMGSGRAPLAPGSATKLPQDDVYRNPVVGGRLLFISSVNDGPVNSWGGGIQIPKEYTVLDETSDFDAVRLASLDRAAIVFQGAKAPNHISYLSESVNDAMLDFLSPLLPLTQALEIPVLDFDKYATSRDSVATGAMIKPLISGFLGNSKKN